MSYAASTKQRKTGGECDERGIYTFYFITIAEIIHLQRNKFRFVLTTSNCFCAIYEVHLFPYTHVL
jgi:hypothetical protein